MKTSNVTTDNPKYSEQIDLNLWDVLGLINRLTSKNEIGYLESKLDNPVINVMSREINTIEHTATLHDAATMMIKKGEGYAVVTRDRIPFGMITEKDVVCAVVGLGTLIKNFRLEIIASRPIIHIHPMQTVRKAASLMISNNIRRLPVMENRKLVGILTVNDFARIISQRTLV